MSDGSAGNLPLYYEAKNPSVVKTLKQWKKVGYSNPEWAVVIGKLKQVMI